MNLRQLIPFGFAVLSGLLVSACDRTPATGATIADSIFVNGRIYTVDENRSSAEAVAIKDGRFLVVGSNDEMEQHAGPSTEVVDLDGKMVLPGLHDAHVHLISGYRQYYAGCRVPGSLQANGSITTLADIENALRKCAEDNADTKGWILGGGFGLATFPPEFDPKAMLDRIFGDRPVFLLEEGSHGAWANSKALEISGLDPQTADPVYGSIVRQPDTGELTGILIDYSAMELVGRHIPTPTLTERMDHTGPAIDIFSSVGVTSFIEAGTTEADLAAFHRLAMDGLLNARMMTQIIAVRSGMTDETVESTLRIRELAEKYATPRLNTFGAKLWLDGIFLNHSVAFDHIKSEHPWLHGNLVVSEERASQAIVELDKAGLQTKMHAMGDHSAHVALNAIEAARQANPDSHLHHHLAHSTFVRPEDLPRFKELDAATDITAFWASPGLIGSDGITSWIGSEYARERGLPLKTYLNNGMRLIGASDWPSSPASPFYSIQVGVTRQNPLDPDGPVNNSNERLTVEEMVDMYTIHGAWLMQQEDLTGSIESGKAADLIVLDRNIFKIPPETLGGTKVLTTLIDGRAIYHAEDSPLLEPAKDLKRATWWW